MLGKKTGKGGFGGYVDMTKGPIIPALIKYTVPIILMGVLQSLYSSADTIILGQFAGKAAFAAVGATSTLVSFIVNTLVSLNVGVSIIIARAFGANDRRRTENTVSTSYVFSLALGILLCVVGELVALPMLRWMDCPSDVIDGAHLYMSIYFIGTPATIFYSFMSPVLNSRGDSTSPLIYSVISGLMNVILNIVFVVGFNIDVAGVAIATVSSQYASAIFLFIKLVRLKDDARLRPFNFKVSFPILSMIVKYGIPSAISSATFSLSNLQIQSAVNTYGQDGISGNTAAGQIDSYIFCIIAAFATAAATSVGQNVGAGDRKRVIKVSKILFIMGFAVTLVLSVLVMVFARPLLSIFLPGEEAALSFGTLRLYGILSLISIYSLSAIGWAILRAFGKNVLQMFVNIIGICGTRLIWMLVIYPLNPTPFNIYLSYPVSYFIVVIFAVFFAVRHLRKYSKGEID